MSETTSPSSKQSSETDLGLLKLGATTVASLTLILVLLGFGVSLAIESKLSLPHASLYESSGELLDLGSVAVLEILPKIFENLGKATTYFEMIAGVWPSFLIFISAYIVIVALVFYLKYVKKIDIKARKDKVTELLGDNDKRGFLARAGLFLLFVLASMLLPIFLYFGLAIAMILLAIVPMVGWFAGMAYIDEVAINDRNCAPLPSVQYYQDKKKQLETKKPNEPKDPKDLVKTVQCVKLIKDDAVIATGRLVLSTSKAAILYLPNGLARRIPITDTVIEVVDKL